MNTLQIILLAAMALLGYPVGKFIASKTKEELMPGRIYFKLIMLACALGIMTSLILLNGDKLILLASSLIFIFLLALASYLD